MTAFHPIFGRRILFRLTLIITAFFIFGSSKSQWVQRGNDIHGDSVGEYSGTSVCMFGASTVAIGAPYCNATGFFSGRTKIYYWDGIAWTQKGANIDGVFRGEYSGWSVHMPDSNTVAIGSIGNDENGPFIGYGRVRVFGWSGTNWVQKGGDIIGEEIHDKFGSCVYMTNANTLAVGAPSNSGGGDYEGHARVYVWDGATWKQKGNDLDGRFESDRFGKSLCMPDTNTIAIGAPFSSGGASNFGFTCVYKWVGNAWVQKGTDIIGEEINDRSGHSVSMPDSNTVAIGARSNPGGASVSSFSGSVRIYSWNGNTWMQKGSDIDGSSGDRFGSAVSMPDSITVAVGATGGNGKVGVFTWNGTSWGQLGGYIDADAAGANELPVSLTGSKCLAFGGPTNDSVGQNTGHVRVFSYCDIEPNFTYSNSGTTVLFTDASTGDFNSWFWDFGDGGIDSVGNPTHSYIIQGSYEVCLTIENSFGCSSTYCDSIQAIVNNDPVQTEGFDVIVSPNPLTSQFALFLVSPSPSRYRIMIFGAMGELLLDKYGLKEGGTHHENIMMDLPTSGIYTLLVDFPRQRISRRLIMQR